MSDAENPNGEHKLKLMYTGVVIDDIDPEKVARVRINIPGLMPNTGWCFPMGSQGGGTFRRGIKMVPRVGSEVCVIFRMGDPDQPYYMPGNWGQTDKGNETPGGGLAPPIEEGFNVEGEEISPEAAKMVHVLETESFLFSIDERATLDPELKGKGSLFIRHKFSGNQIEYDGLSNAWLISAELMTLNISGILDINAPQVQINGRLVRTTDDPI